MTEAGVDQNLYSRQIGVFGMETMGKLVQLDVLIVGMQGVGVETAKNLILAGPRSVSIFDPQPATVADIGRNYYLNESSIGKSRAEASVPRLAELNSYVRVNAVTETTLTDDVLKAHHVVVFCDPSLKPSELYRFNEFCRSQTPAIATVVVNIHGAAGYVQCDFGPSHTVRDADGEPVRSAIVVGLEQGNPGTVMCHEDKRHGFMPGDHVAFTELEGVPELNDGEPRKVVKVDKHTFQVENLTGSGTYVSGGIVEQVKVPVQIAHRSLAEIAREPGMMNTPDTAKFGRPEQLHVAFQGLGVFLERHGSLPLAHHDGHAAEVLEAAQAWNKDQKATATGFHVDEVDADVVRHVATLACTELPALSAFFGGIAAQEVVKATGKYTPIEQTLYVDAFELLPKEPLSAEEVAPTGDRYEDVTAIFGRTAMNALRNKRAFLVGAGALGCELLKNFALMGVGTGETGHIMVTDMDRIEVSNLNRQFLFRPDDVGAPKSTTAAKAAQVMNPDMKITSTEVPVGSDTEDTFDDEFWMGLDVVVNALDNLKARLYVDSKCVFYCKPLLESGTLGTKANTQVVVPFLTESYGDSVDPPEESIPMCTLKNFPFKIEHCIEWARDLFEGSFTQAIQEAAGFAADPVGWVTAATAERNISTRRSKLEAVTNTLASAKVASYDMCVRKARDIFHQHFYIQIRQLLHNFPPDYVDSKGAKFWSGPKRAPTPAEFSLDNATHVGFLVAAAHIVADGYGITPPADADSIEYLSGVLAGHEVPEFVPRSVRIKASDNDRTDEGADDDLDTANQLMEKLETLSSADADWLRSLKLSPAEFEKDDDSNHHIDFMTAASNLRASNYKIKEASRHQCKMIAGKIIPAIATTTCMITGLVCIELYKVIAGVNVIESYKNAFVNLANNIYSMAEPFPPKKQVSKDFDPLIGGPVRAQPEGFSSWDKTVIHGEDMTFGDLEAWVAENLNLEISMVSCGQTMLYAPLLYRNHAERKGRKVTEVFEEVSKTTLNPRKKFLVIDLSLEDDDGDVLVPQTQFFFRK